MTLKWPKCGQVIDPTAHIYIYIYIYVCVCARVCLSTIRRSRNVAPSSKSKMGQGNLVRGTAPHLTPLETYALKEIHDYVTLLTGKARTRSRTASPPKGWSFFLNA